MAKAEYKIKEAKKDKTLSFRISNQLYELLKKTAPKRNKSIGTYARRLLIDYVYSKYPQSDEVLKELKEEKKKLEAELKEMGSQEGEPNWEKLYDEKLKELREIKDKRDEIRSKLWRKSNEIEELELRIRRYEDIRSGVESTVKEYHYFKDEPDVEFSDREIEHEVNEQIEKELREGD